MSQVTPSVTASFQQEASNHLAIEELLRHPQLWRAEELDASPENNIGTGFRILDKQLWGGGWPRSGLMELLCTLYIPEHFH